MTSSNEDNSSWRLRLRRALVRWVGWSHDHYATVIVVMLAITVVSGYFTLQLFQDVRTDFATLLPDTDRSKQDLEELKKRYGGATKINLVVHGQDFEANKAFVERFVGALDKHRDELSIREIRYKLSEEDRFFDEHKFLYVEVEDLEEVDRRLKKRITWEKCKKSPFCLSVEDKPEFTTEDIEEKYRERFGAGGRASDAEIMLPLEVTEALYDRGDEILAWERCEESPWCFNTGPKPGSPDEIVEPFTTNLDMSRPRNRDDYLTNRAGTYLGISVEVAVSGGSLSFIKEFSKKVNELFDSLDPAASGVQLYEWSSLHSRRFQYNLIIEEAIETAGLTIFLVCLVIYLYFRRFRPVLFMGVSVLVAISWTFAITYFQIGYLNQQTAFLGSIIIGNGINFSLIFMARYLEERRRGLGPRDALLQAAENTGGATLTAAFATSIAYGVLMIAAFKGFSQFGFMGGIGMLLCWICSFALVPALLALSERFKPFATKYTNQDVNSGYMGSRQMADLCQQHPRPIIWTAVVLTLISVIFTARLVADPFEYDFGKLRVQLGAAPEIFEDIQAVAIAFGSRGGNAPQVVLTDSREQSEQVAAAYKEKMATPGSTIERVWWLGTLVPENQDEKLEVIERIKKRIDTQPISWMSEEQRSKIEEIRETLEMKPITLENVPETQLERLREKDGTLGRVVLVYPRSDLRMNDGRDLLKVAEEVRRADLEDGTTVWSSGAPVIFADMLKAIVRDGPLTTLVCYLGVILAIWINFRSIRSTAFIMLFLTYGLLLLGGAMGLLDIKVNFFNFIAIPITVGIGVDYHINVYKRYELDGRRSIADAVTRTGGAVLLCSLTTIIGYGVMILSRTPAMVSFGLMAVIGEVTCLTSALLLKPAVLVLMERRRAS